MSSLQPVQNALHLDTVQQLAFIKFYKSLPEKPATTVRIFDRNEYYTVHGEDATTAAREVFSSVSNIKRMGVNPYLDYLVLSKGNFEILIKKLLLVRRYRVEIYVAEGSVKNSEWFVKYKGSPGCLSQLEEVLGEGLGVVEDGAPCLMAVNIGADSVTKGRVVGVATVIAGDYRLEVAQFADDDLLTHLETIAVQVAPAECLVPLIENDDYKALQKVMDRSNITVTKLKRSGFSTEGLIQDLNRLLKFKESQQQDANAFSETSKEVAMTSLAAAIKYTSLLSDNTNFGRFRLSTVESECFLELDAAALSALNVFPEPGDVTRAPSRSLYGLFDRCRTQQGKRLLGQWLRQPLRDINLINERLDVVELLMNDSALRLQLHDDHLRRIPDLHALTRKLTRKKANLHDCYKIYQTINRLPHLLKCLSETQNSTVHSSITEPISELNEDLTKFQQMIEATLDMDAVEKGEFLVKSSFDPALERLWARLQESSARAHRELSRTAEDLSLDATKTIKLENHPTQGYYFRVTLKEEHSLRGNKKYTIIDAYKSGVRFKSSALQSIAEEYLQTKEDYEKEQDKVVTEIVSIAGGYSECLFCLSHLVSRLDVLVSFSVAAASAPRPYCRPRLTACLDRLELHQLRHPCLEVQDGVSFIANDVIFHRESSLMHIVTGANMGGKSTWMRACGAAALLAHAGCAVPAERALLPLLRSVRARVGAHDAERAGHSTFMTEMIDTANILKTATPDSLVLIDELGRGTSTYEGCGIAWAIAEELATNSKCFCLFATHYHELTRLPALVARVVNTHVQAAVVDRRLVLLHTVAPGPATHSLGIHVARLAGLPQSILEYAEEKQAQLETNLFDDATSDSETAEGQKIMMEFLRNCKQFQEATSSDDVMMDQINQLKLDLKKHDNKYLLSLMS